MAFFVIWGGSFGGMAAGSALFLRQKGRELRQVFTAELFLAANNPNNQLWFKWFMLIFSKK